MITVVSHRLDPANGKPPFHGTLTAGSAPTLGLIRRERWLPTVADHSGDGSVLILVHGYNTPRERFYERLLDLAPRMRAEGFTGAFVGFDWPAGGNPFGYDGDRTRAIAAAPRLMNDVIRPLARQFGAAQTHLLAHSMGSFLTIRALRSGAPGGQLLGHAIMTASDVDRDALAPGRSAGDVLAARARRLTHYHNTQDEVLAVPGTVVNGLRQRSGRRGLPARRYSTHQDVHCTDHYAEQRRGSGLTDAALFQFSHGWWFEDDTWVADAAQTLRRDPAADQPHSRELA
ncbi:alpha/beta hydrolase [Jannaschia donghaensis]|uniref:Alpha/beta hydrolase family protein n=1 Tax=Jannaschia donghaensis TaxID=420998 RepID=A0A0M6YQ33_9RHOB|nr:alpha/beta hydrolase [Jannaschia donghaensis]CTQ51357.1 hypothetical protein JDO7802_03396 [Jannaschia donghaensis]